LTFKPAYSREMDSVKGTRRSVAGLCWFWKSLRKNPVSLQDMSGYVAEWLTWLSKTDMHGGRNVGVK